MIIARIHKAINERSEFSSICIIFFVFQILATQAIFSQPVNTSRNALVKTDCKILKNSHANFIKEFTSKSNYINTEQKEVKSNNGFFLINVEYAASRLLKYQASVVNYAVFLPTKFYETNISRSPPLFI